MLMHHLLCMALVTILSVCRCSPFARVSGIALPWLPGNQLDMSKGALLMLELVLCWSPCPIAQGWPLAPWCAYAGTWPLAPTAIGPSLPAQEASCPFGRMGEMEKAPPLPWANTAPLSSYPGERNSQVPAGTVTSPPGNAFPRPAGKGALVSPKELPGFPHPKPFPAVSILDGAGGCNFSSVEKGCYHFSQPGELGWAASFWGRQPLQTHKLLWRRGASTIHRIPSEILLGA